MYSLYQIALYFMGLNSFQTIQRIFSNSYLLWAFYVFSTVTVIIDNLYNWINNCVINIILFIWVSLFKRLAFPSQSCQVAMESILSMVSLTLERDPWLYSCYLNSRRNFAIEHISHPFQCVLFLVDLLVGSFIKLGFRVNSQFLLLSLDSFWYFLSHPHQICGLEIGTSIF